MTGSIHQQERELTGQDREDGPSVQTENEKKFDAHMKTATSEIEKYNAADEAHTNTRATTCDNAAKALLSASKVKDEQEQLVKLIDDMPTITPADLDSLPSTAPMREKGVLREMNRKFDTCMEQTPQDIKDKYEALKLAEQVRRPG